MTDLINHTDTDFATVVPMSAIAPPPAAYHKKDAPRHSPTMTPAEARTFYDTYDSKFSGERTGVGKSVRCPVCSRVLKSSSGFSPHWRSHLSEAEIVLGMPVSEVRKSGRMSKKDVEKRLPKSPPQPKRTVEPQPELEFAPASIQEGLIAMLPYYLGPNATVPVDRLMEFQAWLSASEQFISSLRT